MRDEGDLERAYLDAINEANVEIQVKERAHGLCEVCYKSYNLCVHHIGGRGNPHKSWPIEIQREWPHILLNVILICEGTHGSGDRSDRVHTALKHNAPALWALLLALYGKDVWGRKTYAEWFAGAGPWERWAKHWTVLEALISVERGL